MPSLWFRLYLGLKYPWSLSHLPDKHAHSVYSSFQGSPGYCNLQRIFLLSQRSQGHSPGILHYSVCSEGSLPQGLQLWFESLQFIRRSLTLGRRLIWRLLRGCSWLLLLRRLVLYWRLRLLCALLPCLWNKRLRRGLKSTSNCQTVCGCSGSSWSLIAWLHHR